MGKVVLKKEYSRNPKFQKFVEEIIIPGLEKFNQRVEKVSEDVAKR